MKEADAAILLRMREGHREYEERFGRIFIVCASGKQPAEMLSILERRLTNDPAQELLESAAQQQQIMQLRLRKWLAHNGGCMSRLSTHVLDTALGRPAAGMVVHLEYAGPSGEWENAEHLRDGRDGRCANLLPQDQDPILQPGQYRLRFETGTYHAAQMVKGLYLTVEIIVTVRPGDTHLHVPLLLSPNGYTTYRGS